MKVYRLLIAGLLLSLVLTGCGSGTGETDTQQHTGRGMGFGGVITATVTTKNGAITDVKLDGPNETAGIGDVALDSLSEQIIAAGGVDIDGVSGATATTNGSIAAVQNALDPAAYPFVEPEPAAADNSDLGPVTIPAGRNIVSATTYGIYTKMANSPQDAVIKTTLYYDLDADSIFAIRFLQPMLPWDDNSATSGWANVTDEALIEALGDAVISFTAQSYGSEVSCNFAKFLQIGGIVWTGELGSTPASETAVVYSGDVSGQTVLLVDYVATEMGGAWYHEAATQDVYFLTSGEAAASADDEQVASVYTITYKETNGHGVGYWPSDLNFPLNIEAIKAFVIENGFDYNYYRDGGITQDANGYWGTVDAISGATMDETPTYWDHLKLLYERIKAGDYTVEG